MVSLCSSVLASLVIALSSLVLALASRASAQWGPSSLDEADVQRSVRDVQITAWVEMPFYAGHTSQPLGADLVSFSPSIGLRGRFVELVAVELEIPFALGSYDLDDGGQSTDFRTGNPTVSVFATPRLYEDRDLRLEFHGGAGVALPGANQHRPEPLLDADEIRQSAASVYNLGLAIGSRGVWSPWRYYPEHWGLFATAGLELFVRGGLYFASELATAGFFATRDGLFGEDGRDGSGGQLSIEGGVEPLDWIRISLWLAGFGFFDDGIENNDDFQLAMEPRLTLASGGFFAQLGFLLNLDEPFGIGGEDDDQYPGVWSVRVVVGGRT